MEFTGNWVESGFGVEIWISEIPISSDSVFLPHWLRPDLWPMNQDSTSHRMQGKKKKKTCVLDGGCYLKNKTIQKFKKKNSSVCWMVDAI